MSEENVDGPTWGYRGDKAKLFESDEARREAKYSDAPNVEPVEPETDDSEHEDG